VDNEFKYSINDTLCFELLLRQKQFHEAYCSKPLERKLERGKLNLSSEQSLLIQLNKASHILAYFTKNEIPEQRFITQREKRWKDNRKNLALTLAQLHAEELQLSKQKKEKTDQIKKKFMLVLLIASKFKLIYLLLNKSK
jgi:hypothetical protein